MVDKKEEIVLGGGCFWCVEAAFKEVRGVVKTIPGYAGGVTPNPKYEDVCRGDTGHAEVVLISYDTGQVSLEQILKIFFGIHDPTSLNRQGGDEGPQYRSIILYSSEEQREAVEDFMNEIAHNYDRPLVTELKKLESFWPAEDYHHDYYRKNPNQAYCRVVIQPKLEELRSRNELPLKRVPGKSD